MSVATDPAVISVDFYSGTGSSHPLVTSIGPCITATAGTQTVTATGTTSRGGGSYQAATPGNNPTGYTCTGGRGRFSYVVDTATTDGATAANTALTVTDAADDTVPSDPTGTTTLDGPTQHVDIAIGPHSAGFGPGHSGFGGFLDLRGDVEIGSSAVIGTTDLQLTKTAPGSVAAGSPISYQLTRGT